MAILSHSVAAITVITIILVNSLGASFAETTRPDSTHRARIAAGEDHYQPAIRLSEAGKHAESIAYANRWLASHPDDGRMYYIRASEYLKLRKYMQAQKDFELAVRFAPTASTPYNGLAWTHYCLGEYAAGLTVIEQCLRINPRSANAWDTRACLLAGSGRWDEALQSSNRACALDPKSSSLADNRRLIKHKTLPPY